MASRPEVMHTGVSRDRRSQKVIDIATFVAWIVLAIISLPLRLVGISVSAVFDLIGAIIRLPARLLRGKPA